LEDDRRGNRRLLLCQLLSETVKLEGGHEERVTLAHTNYFVGAADRGFDCLDEPCG
jgi:hypothetical protein